MGSVGGGRARVPVSVRGSVRGLMIENLLLHHRESPSTGHQSDPVPSRLVSCSFDEVLQIEPQPLHLHSQALAHHSAARPLWQFFQQERWSGAPRIDSHEWLSDLAPAIVVHLVSLAAWITQCEVEERPPARRGVGAAAVQAAPERPTISHESDSIDQTQSNNGRFTGNRGSFYASSRAMSPFCSSATFAGRPARKESCVAACTDTQPCTQHGGGYCESDRSVGSPPN